MKIALSTCWNSSTHTDGYLMLQEAAELGFEYVELSHGIRMSLVPGVMKAIQEGVVKVASTHNFCPLPAGIIHAAPNLYQPTAKDRREREMWLRHTRKTVEFAAEMGADHVVVHSGSVSVFWDGALKKMMKYRKGKDNSILLTDMYYAMLVEKAMAKVRPRAEEAMKRLIEMLHAIAPVAKEHGIGLGLENRDGLKELPLDNEYPRLLPALEELGVFGYWHDSGHAKVKEQMGLLYYEPHLEQVKDNILGWHLKDCDENGHENLEIGEGCIDFNLISNYFNKDQTLTLEVSPRLEADAIVRSREKLEQLVQSAGL